MTLSVLWTADVWSFGSGEGGQEGKEREEGRVRSEPNRIPNRFRVVQILGMRGGANHPPATGPLLLPSLF